MKGNFLLKRSQGEIFATLTDEEAGKLIKGIFKYLETGNSGLDGMMKAIFIPIQKDIDKNETKYQQICEKNRENVRKRWEKEKIPNDTSVCFGKENNTNEYQTIPNDTDINHISYITNHNIIDNLENNKGVIGEKEETFISQVKKIIDYLNVKTKSNFRYTSQKTQSKINARLNEGYTLNDFIVVIDKKTDEWLEDPEFCKYLCPETLFGTKFEKYLNQKTTTKQKTKSDEQWEFLKGVYNGTIKID